MARINFFDQFADNDEVIITGETSFDNNVKYSSFSGSITVNDLLEVYRKTMLDNPRIWVAIIEVNFFRAFPIGHSHSAFFREILMKMYNLKKWNEN